MPVPISTLRESEIDIVPYPHAAESSVDFGAVVTNIDLGKLSDTQFSALEDALYRHKVLVVKGQDALTPTEQFNLVCRFDPEAKREHGHGSRDQAAAAYKGKQTLLEKAGIPAVPSQPEVRLIGHGPQPAEWGFPEGMEISQVSHTLWHEKPLTPEEILAGNTRWNRWHIDASFYERAPPIVTTLHAFVVPQGPPLTCRWDDGSGLTMPVQAGATAFLSGAFIYSRLSEEEKRIVENSTVTYAPHPFRKHSAVRGRSNGMGQVSEGREQPLEDLPDWDESKVLTYPMLWTNPVTGEKSFQVHSIAAWKLNLRSSPDEEYKVVDDIAEVRKFLYSIQRPALEPKNIFAPPYEKGDLVMFYNRGVFHAAVEYPIETHGPRTMHQAHVAGSKHPV